jgi:hypothetical protein
MIRSYLRLKGNEIDTVCSGITQGTLQTTIAQVLTMNRTDFMPTQTANIPIKLLAST